MGPCVHCAPAAIINCVKKIFSFIFEQPNNNNNYREMSNKLLPLKSDRVMYSFSFPINIIYWSEWSLVHFPEKVHRVKVGMGRGWLTPDVATKSTTFDDIICDRCRNNDTSTIQEKRPLFYNIPDFNIYPK